MNPPLRNCDPYDTQDAALQRPGTGLGWLLCVAVILLALILAALFSAFTYDPAAPRFQKAMGLKIPPYDRISYNFLDQRPFAGDTIWINLYNGTNNVESFLFDLAKRKSTGQLLNAQPLHFNADHSRLLCMTRGPAKMTRLERAKAWVADILNRVRMKQPKWLRAAKPNYNNDYENFWVLDVNRNSATYVGRIPQLRGAGSRFRVSPDFRYAFNKPTTAPITNLVYLLDMEKKRLDEIHVDGWPMGWWDNRTLLAWSSNNDLRLVDVVTGTGSNLLLEASITNFLDQHGVERKGQKPSAFGAWNGREFEFYITDTHRKWSAEESFLLKVERPDGRLALVSPSFKFEWSDGFDESQRYYVYTGREAGNRSDGVFLRDLKTGEDTTLVPPAGERTFSIPNFYGKGVIYISTNTLWFVGLEGKGNVRLFPP